MNNRIKSVTIGMSGFLSGSLAAAIVSLPTWPKAGLAALVSFAVSMTVWFFLRPKTTP